MLSVAVRRSTDNDVCGHYFRRSFFLLFIFSSVAIFSYNRRWCSVVLCLSSVLQYSSFEAHLFLFVAHSCSLFVACPSSFVHQSLRSLWFVHFHFLSLHFFFFNFLFFILYYFFLFLPLVILVPGPSLLLIYFLLPDPFSILNG